MGATKVNREEKFDNDKESRVGTWISLGVLLGVILVSYFVLFGLYMDRV